MPAAFNMTTGPAHWELTFRARALDNQVFMVGCSQARQAEGYISYGNSIITSPWGEVIGKMDEKEGRWVQYSGDIIISEENYKSGKRDGVQRFFYTTGKISEEYIYENGKEKEYKRYSQEGKLISQGKRF